MLDRDLVEVGEEKRGGPAHILVVDDEPHICRLLQANLERAGFRVTWVSGIPDARAAIQSNRPALVILDYFLSSCAPSTPDGPTLEERSRASLDFCRELRHGAATREMPVIIVGLKWANVADWRATIPPLMALAQRPAICKPFNPAELADLVRIVLDHGEGAAPKRI